MLELAWLPCPRQVGSAWLFSPRQVSFLSLVVGMGETFRGFAPILEDLGSSKPSGSLRILGKTEVRGSLVLSNEFILVGFVGEVFNINSFVLLRWASKSRERLLFGSVPGRFRPTPGLGGIASALGLG